MYGLMDASEIPEAPILVAVAGVSLRPFAAASVVLKLMPTIWGGVAASVTCTIVKYEPALVTVPVTLPVEVSRFRPGGSPKGAVTAKVYGGVPPAGMMA